MGWEFGELVHEYYEKHKEEIDLPILYKNTLENILTLIKNSECYANKKNHGRRKNKTIFAIGYYI